MAYSLVAVDFLPNRAVQSALRRLSADLGSGALRPMPQVVHSLDSVQAALRQMSQARHVGKIVVNASSALPSGTRAAGRVIVTGGLGSLGSLTAGWLARCTGLHVVATGRTGRLASSTTLAGLLGTGCAVELTLSTADAACAEDAALLLASSGSEVVGVVHASGVLADATLRNQTLAGIRAACAPKAAALRQLDGWLRLAPGSFQLLFSSIASLLGSPGQANYSAANALLDNAAQATQAQVRWFAARCTQAHVLNRGSWLRRG